VSSHSDSVSPPSPWEAVTPAGPILRPAEAAKYLGLSIQCYYLMASRGDLPSPVKIGTRASGVPRPWLDAVIADRVLHSSGAAL
jgi:predicted DNA-binding transcriptional regulator AlpA